MVFFMQKNRLLTGALILFLMIIVSSCGIEKISRKKIKDIDFTVVAEIEMPLEVKQIVEERNSLLRLHILIINIHILSLDMEDKIIRATALRSTTCMKQKTAYI